ncbi:hypothetical protein ABOM_002046 [Aspergillus bombycis]|uniref:Zn(2)-C6 fungal-type domain-containing protein n=1 Tax=Aspergillus bombycis TaxID=109264 RepID=A0A1F8AAG9_9EURO|nr:hypothetical protein ABOM_002046 [Aspergillus bombycis]OGM48641.1 hypothetical protein ABOM_002046 [Aspergillus bombycis]
MPNSESRRTEARRLRKTTPAPYGQACINCARAKCKCLLLATGDQCERCDRLGKECRPSLSARMRRKGSSNTRIARVESRLDSLLSALQSPSISTQSSSGSEGVRKGDNSLEGHAEESPSPYDVQTRTPVFALPASDNPNPLDHVSSDAATRALEQFRTENLSYLPYIHIPPHVTPQELMKEKPFFWYCLTAVLTPNLTHRESLFTKVHNTIYQELLVDIAPNMDILLGLMTFMSCIASSLFKSDALRWTPHMEESLEILASTKECIGDELLVWLVRIQLVVDKSYHLRRDDSVKRQIPSPLRKNNVISMYFSNAELAIHEVLIKAPIPINCPDPQGLKSLHVSLLAAKSWLDVWLCVPPEHYLGVSFTILFQFCRALVNLFKLSTLDDPAWDKNGVQDSANLLHYLDHLQINFKRSSDHLGQDAEDNIFEKGVKMISAIKERWGPSLMQARQYLPATEAANPTLQNTLGNPDDLRLDGIDDAWMMELLGFL